MVGRKKQQGMTAIGWMLVLGLIAFFTLITLRLAPLYLEYTKVVSVLESLESEPGITRKTKAEIRSMLSKRFQINDINELSPKQASIVVQGGVLKVGMDYERRVSLLGNIDLVAKFDKAVEIVAN